MFVCLSICFLFLFFCCCSFVVVFCNANTKNKPIENYTFAFPITNGFFSLHNTGLRKGMEELQSKNQFLEAKVDQQHQQIQHLQHNMQQQQSDFVRQVKNEDTMSMSQSSQHAAEVSDLTGQVSRHLVYHYNSLMRMRERTRAHTHTHTHTHLHIHTHTHSHTCTHTHTHTHAHTHTHTCTHTHTHAHTHTHTHTHIHTHTYTHTHIHTHIHRASHFVRQSQCKQQVR